MFFKKELLNRLIAKDFIPAEKYQKLENMKKLTLIDNDDFKPWNKVRISLEAIVPGHQDLKRKEVLNRAATGEPA